MSYQVFARKYRPKTFDDIVGQDHITRTLRNAIEQNRLAHAYLFVGPRGTGKTSTARIIAKALNCEGGPMADFNPDEEICREIAEGRCLDVLEIDGASNNGVEQIRELRENVRFAPSRGKFKIYIIDEVHMLTSGAFNALLKTLEEPPDHVKFIFATTEPQKVLPTILSRCQRFDLRRIPASLIAGHLQYIAREEKITLDETAAMAIARGADGGLRDAESMLDQLVAFCGEEIAESDVLSVFGFTSQQTVCDLCSAVIDRDTASALGIVHEQSEDGKDMMKLLGELVAHLRNLLVLQVDPQTVEAETSADLHEIMKAQADAVPPAKLLELIDQFASSEGRMKWAPNKRLHFEIAVIRAVQLLETASLDEVIDALESVQSGETPKRRSHSPAVERPRLLQKRPRREPPPAGNPMLEKANPDSPSTPRPTPEMTGTKPESPPAATSKNAPDPEPPPAPSEPSGRTKPTDAKPAAPESPPPPAAQPPDAEPPSTTPKAADARPGRNATRDGTDSPPPPEPPHKEEVVSNPPDTNSPELREIWIALVHAMRVKPLIHASLIQGEAIACDEKSFTIGFPEEAKLSAKTLRDSERLSMIENQLAGILGRKAEIQIRIVPDLKVLPVPVEKVEAEKDPMEEFKEDPLIRKALEAFKGQIQTAQ